MKYSIDQFMAVGVDPGKTGCIALKRNTGFVLLEFAKCDPRSVRESIKSWYLYKGLTIGFEGVGPRPDDDPYSAFTFGRNTGVVQGWIEMTELPVVYVPPQTWQLEFGLGGIDPKVRKKFHCAKANELFSQDGLRFTQKNSDSVLIAEYMDRKYKGTLTHGQDSNRTLRPATGIIRRTSVLE